MEAERSDYSVDDLGRKKKSLYNQPAQKKKDSK